MGTHPIFESDFDCLTAFQTMDKSGPNRFVFPTGLNILDKDTKIIVNKISRTRELSETAKTSIDIRNVTPRKRVVFQCPTATLVPNTKGKREHERQKEAKEVFGMGQSRAFQMERGKIVTHVKNYEATTRQQIRDDKIREIMKSDRKRRKEEKKLRAEKSKSCSKSTAIIIKGLQDKTFRKSYIRRHLEKFGEIVRISSVVGQARSVMIRFSDASVCKKVYRVGSKDITQLFPRFPKAEIKLVKSDKNSDSVAAFQPVRSHPLSFIGIAASGSGSLTFAPFDPSK